MPDRPTHIYDRPRSMGGTVDWTDRPHTAQRFAGDVDALAEAMRERVRGEVRFDRESRSLYATDASNYRQVPIGVVVPWDVEDIVAAVAVCRQFGAPITHRGGGTSLAGQSCNHAVIIDSSKYCTNILEIDPERKIARVEPGVIRDKLTDRTEKEYHLSFAPDTSTHQWATFGGMIGNNACGVHSQMARRTQDNVEELEILTYDGIRLRVGPTSDADLDRLIAEGGRKGEIYRKLRDLRDRYAGLIRERYPDIPRRVSGYNLTELLPERGFNVARALVGTEGTCVTILEATVKLIHSPPVRTVLVLGFEDIYHAADHMCEIGELGATALEGMDRRLIHYMQEKNLHTEYLHLLPDGDGFLIVEFGGDTREEANRNAREALEDLRSRDWEHLLDVAFIDNEEDRRKLMLMRESGLAATAHLPEGETWPGWEDSALPPERLGDYLRDLQTLYDKYGFDAALYGHFGQGCVHTRIPFDLRTADGLRQYRAFVDEASDLCMAYGGSFSAEHGDGQARGELLPKMFGEELIEAFREFKRIWDPDWKMNPGKVVDPYRMDENLRLGTDYSPPDPETYFAFPEDGGSFAHAAMRCVGVGRCRRRELEAGDVMCPSYIATREEAHSTRGRARLLFEMLNSDESPGPWDDEAVLDALDLCLSCKGCKNDCPVNVDMATYKAEFLSHYYKDHRRPRHAFAFGLIYWWAQVAAKMPNLVNAVTQSPALSRVAKKVGGIAQEREIPRFASQTFRDWVGQRARIEKGRYVLPADPQRPEAERRHVILFPDTFNNFFKVDTARAAVDVLLHAGYDVVVPRQMLCCGRPLYEYGWISLAKKLWREMLDAFREDVRAGTTIVGLEPSCIAAFRDELPNLFPHDEDARRLSRSVLTLGEFLTAYADGYEPPRLERKALLHGHCHHNAILGIEDEHDLLAQMGVDFELLNSGCCGVAGAFGFEEGHYEVSMQCGEYALLPRVRSASPDTLIIADGFSCREQIQHATPRHGLHLAEVLHMALHPDDVPRDFPETPYVTTLREPVDDPGNGHDASALQALWHRATEAFGQVFPR